MTATYSKIQPSPDVIIQVLDNEAVLLHLKTEQYYTLDSTGLRIWQLLTEHEEPEAVVADMQKEFDVNEATAQSDVARLVNELNQEGLVDVVE